MLRYALLCVSVALAQFLPFAVTALAADRCLAVAQRQPKPVIEKAGLRLAQLQSGEVRITYVGHSTFQIDSPKGVRIATDYNDYVRPAEIPDIATMNRAHSSHYTDLPDPRIRHVLRGWSVEGGQALHDVLEQDVRVRNVATNIRDWSGGTYEFGNSIFIYEVGDICIAHLGHLHHTLTANQLAQIGQMDVVLVPVDGSYTLDLPGMQEVLKSLRAPLMIPMHYFSSFTLSRFLDVVKADYEIRHADLPTVVVSRTSLPPKPQVLVLPGR